MSTEDSDSMEVPGFEIRFIDEYIGKGVFATKAYAPGDVIFEERPLVCSQFLWNAAYGYLACDHCLRPLETAEENVRRLTFNPVVSLPHSECCETDSKLHMQCEHCDVPYCSKGCKEQAWKEYHRTLCMGQSKEDPTHPLRVLQEAWKYVQLTRQPTLPNIRQLHYPPETASIMLLARMIATVRQAEDKEGAMHLFMQFCHRTTNEDEEIAHKLLGDKFKIQLEDLRQLMIKALYGDDVSQWLTPDGFRAVVALVGTNGQGVGTSALSVWVRNCDALELPDSEREKLDKFIDQLYEEIEEKVGSFLNNEGSALYQIQSTCNHSCVPNAMPGFPFSDHRLVMSATQPIQPGEQVCVSYLDECTLSRNRHSRHKILRQNYLFVCRCSKCESQKDDPDVTSESEDEEDDEAMEDDQAM